MNADRIRKLRALKLKQMRTDKQLTQQQLADLSGVDRKTIVRIESGETGWNSDCEHLLLEVLENLNKAE